MSSHLLWSLPETVTRSPDFPWAVSSSSPFYTKQLTSNISLHFLCLFNSFFPALFCLSENSTEFTAMTVLNFVWLNAADEPRLQGIFCVFLCPSLNPSQAPRAMCQFYLYISYNSSPARLTSLHGTLPQGLGLRAGEEKIKNEGAGSAQVREEIPPHSNRNLKVSQKGLRRK